MPPVVDFSLSAQKGQLNYWANKKPIEKFILEKNCTSKTPIKIGFYILGGIFSSKFRKK